MSIRTEETDDGWVIEVTGKPKDKISGFGTLITPEALLRGKKVESVQFMGDSPVWAVNAVEHTAKDILGADIPPEEEVTMLAVRRRVDDAVAQERSRCLAWLRSMGLDETWIAYLGIRDGKPAPEKGA